MAAAILVIGLSTYLSATRIRASLPGAVYLPGPAAVAGRPGPSGGPAAGPDRLSTPKTVDPSPAETTTTDHPAGPEPVAPQYPLHQSAGTVAGSGTTTAPVTADPGTDAPSTTTASSGTQGQPDSPDRGAQPVAPDYPVVTSPSTTTSPGTSPTTDP